jgi:hypothetical protein
LLMRIMICSCVYLNSKCIEIYTEPVLLNVHGALESIPRNEFHQPIWPGGPVR